MTQPNIPDPAEQPLKSEAEILAEHDLQECERLKSQLMAALPTMNWQVSSTVPEKIINHKGQEEQVEFLYLEAQDTHICSPEYARRLLEKLKSAGVIRNESGRRRIENGFF